MKLVRSCTEESYFTISIESYKSLKKAPIWYPLSPFMNEIFISNLETKLASIDLMPRFWKTYVDDICTILMENDVDKTLDLLNRLHRLAQKQYRAHPGDGKGKSIIFLEHVFRRKQKNSYGDLQETDRH